MRDGSVEALNCPNTQRRKKRPQTHPSHATEPAPSTYLRGRFFSCKFYLSFRSPLSPSPGSAALFAFRFCSCESERPSSTTSLNRPSSWRLTYLVSRPVSISSRLPDPFLFAIACHPFLVSSEHKSASLLMLQRSSLCSDIWFYVDFEDAFGRRGDRHADQTELEVTSEALLAFARKTIAGRRVSRIYQAGCSLQGSPYLPVLSTFITARSLSKETKGLIPLRYKCGE